MGRFLKKWLALIISVVAILCSLAGIIVLDKLRYRECINNAPTINYIEEDLEAVFMTTFVVVYDYEQEEECLYVKVEANNLTYKVEYKIKRLALASFGWKYNRYIEIREIEDD